MQVQSRDFKPDQSENMETPQFVLEELPIQKKPIRIQRVTESPADTLRLTQKLSSLGIYSESSYGPNKPQQLDVVLSPDPRTPPTQRTAS